MEEMEEKAARRWAAGAERKRRKRADNRAFALSHSPPRGNAGEFFVVDGSVASGTSIARPALDGRLREKAGARERGVRAQLQPARRAEERAKGEGDARSGVKDIRRVTDTKISVASVAYSVERRAAARKVLGSKPGAGCCFIFFKYRGALRTPTPPAVDGLGSLIKCIRT